MATIATALSVRSQARSVSWGRYVCIALATIGAAVAANTLFYVIADVLVTYNADFEILTSVGPTIAVTAQAATIAVLLYAALLRFSSNAPRLFTIIAVIVLAASVVPDLTYVPGLPGASNAQTAVLVLMHIVAAAVIVPMLTILAPSRAR